jgi:hypothetical protein
MAATAALTVPGGRSRYVSARPAMRPVPVPWSSVILNPSPPDDRRKVASACCRGVPGWRWTLPATHGREKGLLIRDADQFYDAEQANPVTSSLR